MNHGLYKIVFFFFYSMEKTDTHNNKENKKRLQTATYLLCYQEPRLLVHRHFDVEIRVVLETVELLLRTIPSDCKYSIIMAHRLQKYL